jgi:hypothetical protein
MKKGSQLKKEGLKENIKGEIKRSIKRKEEKEGDRYTPIQRGF